MLVNEEIVAANEEFLRGKEEAPKEYPERSLYICKLMRKRFNRINQLESQLVSDFCSNLPLTKYVWEMKGLYYDLNVQFDRERKFVSSIVDTPYNVTGSAFVTTLYRTALDKVKGRINELERR
ncbi:MAG TPA: hypothetical protein VMV58_01845 [Desulfosporosinus sp.]|nr:hypothetical protein [Desulfosporosinus sp.]